MIREHTLTAAQRATLSNTICGDLQSARELEQMGLLEITKVEQRGNAMVAFFNLTEIGDAFVNGHYVIPDSSASS